MKNNNPHTWFFAHLKTIEGYGTGFDEVIKESIILQYSAGKTDSLKILFEKYPKDYSRMRSELTSQAKQQADELDKARKRLIAAIFANMNDRGYQPDMNYVKRVACKGAKVERFNDIPLNSLQDLYNRFRNKNLQTSVDNLLKSINNI